MRRVPRLERHHHDALGAARAAQAAQSFGGALERVRPTSLLGRALEGIQLPQLLPPGHLRGRARGTDRRVHLVTIPISI